MLTRPLTDSDARGRDLAAVTPPPLLPLADERDDKTQTGVFSPPRTGWRSSPSFIPPSVLPFPLRPPHQTPPLQQTPPLSLTHHHTLHQTGLGLGNAQTPPLTITHHQAAPIHQTGLGHGQTPGLRHHSSVLPLPVPAAVLTNTQTPPLNITHHHTVPIHQTPPLNITHHHTAPIHQTPPLNITHHHTAPIHQTPLLSPHQPRLGFGNAQTPPLSLTHHQTGSGLETQLTPPCPITHHQTLHQALPLNLTPHQTTPPVQSPPLTHQQTGLGAELGGSTPPCPLQTGLPPPCPPPCPLQTGLPPPCPPPCPCSLLLPRLLSAHRQEVRRLLRTCLSSVGRRLERLERQTGRLERQTGRRPQRSKRNTNAAAAPTCSAAPALSPVSLGDPVPLLSPSHIPPVTFIKPSAPASSDREGPPPVSALNESGASSHLTPPPLCHNNNNIITSDLYGAFPSAQRRLTISALSQSQASRPQAPPSLSTLNESGASKPLVPPPSPAVCQSAARQPLVPPPSPAESQPGASIPLVPPSLSTLNQSGASKPLVPPPSPALSQSEWPRRSGRKRRRKNHGETVEEEEEEAAGRFVGRMAFSLRGREGEGLRLQNYSIRKHTGQSAESWKHTGQSAESWKHTGQSPERSVCTDQSEKAVCVVRQNGFSSPTHNALRLLQSAAVSESEAFSSVCSGQWRFSASAAPLSFSSNHRALSVWLSGSTSSLGHAPILRLSAVAVETMTEPFRGGVSVRPQRPLRDWTAPPSLGSDHCYMRALTQSPTLSARQQQKQRTNHSARSLRLPRRRSVPLALCSANGLPASLPASESEASANGEVSQRVKRVSQIRIRRASPRETLLTPMGLPKVKRLRKKEFSLEEIYTNKNYKSPSTNRSLETIFEEPRELLIGQQRRRRILLFPDFTQPRKRKRPQGAGLPVAMVPRKRLAARRHLHGNGDDDADLDVMLVERLSALEDYLSKQGLDL